MRHVWNWDGRYFGYVDGEGLWTYVGNHVGRLTEQFIYGPDGAYRGELRGDRLIASIRRKTSRAPTSCAESRRNGVTRLRAFPELTLYSGYEQFPEPATFIED